MANKRGLQSSSKSETSVNKERVRFIFEPDRHSPNGITFTWLIHKTYNGKEKAATATRAFWLPFAYRDNGNSSEAELRELAQQSIWKLEEQIQYLRESFGLEAALRPIVPVTFQAGKPEAIASNPQTPEPIEAQSNILENLSLTNPQDLLDEFSEAI